MIDREASFNFALIEYVLTFKDPDCLNTLHIIPTRTIQGLEYCLRHAAGENNMHWDDDHAHPDPVADPAKKAANDGKPTTAAAGKGAKEERRHAPDGSALYTKAEFIAYFDGSLVEWDAAIKEDIVETAATVVSTPTEKTEKKDEKKDEKTDEKKDEKDEADDRKRLNKFDSKSLVVVQGVKCTLWHSFQVDKEAVVQLDWSTDNRYLKSVTDHFDLFFWDVVKREGPVGGWDVTKAISKEKRKALRDVQWATNTCTLGWPVNGIWVDDGLPSEKGGASMYGCATNNVMGGASGARPPSPTLLVSGDAAGMQ